MKAETPGKRENPRTVYADIIDLPHWDSPVHSRMSMHERAAQFAPYAALVGYDDMVKEEERETGVWTDPGEDDEEELSRIVAEIGKLLAQGIRPVCTITWFVPDERKDGGGTTTATEAVRRIDSVRRRIVLAKRTGISGAYEEIDMDRIIRISYQE